MQEIFSYLVKRGFVFDKNKIESTQLYNTVQFTGKNTAIVFSYDIQEKVCDCFIGKVINGELLTNINQGGFLISLFNYAVKKHNYRGGIKPLQPILYKEYSDLYIYDILLVDICPEILADSVDFFPFGASEQ